MFYSLGEALIDIFEKEGQELLGGTSVNFCASIAKLGGSASIITKIGNADSAKIIKELKFIGVDTSQVIIDPIHPTGKVIMSSVNGNSLCERRKLCADCNISEEEIDVKRFSSGDVLHFCSFALRECPTIYALQKSIDFMLSRGGKIAFDINLRPRQWEDMKECKAAVNAALARTHYLKASEEDLRMVSNKPFEEIIQSFFAFSETLSVVILTKGEKGSELYTRDGKVFYSRKYDTPVVDTTGAGDCLFATAVLLLSKHIYNYQEIIDISTAASALQMQELGSIAGIPSLKQLDDFLEKYV
ncbi:MAG: hypothetical protein GX625_14090 [Clostridiaceae bacterium]|jgi:fructokinase|nr:hypothetical protein [Clostridiaceae bacterium]